MFLLGISTVLLASCLADEEESDYNEESDEEVEEIEINGVLYFTNNNINGNIYNIINDDIGDNVGIFKNSIPKFF